MFCLYPNLANAEELQEFDDWIFGNMNDLGVIWTCAGFVNWEKSVLLIAYRGGKDNGNDNEVIQLIYKDGDLSNELPQRIRVRMDQTFLDLTTMDYQDRPKNEVPFPPFKYSDEYFSELRKSDNVTFFVDGQKMGPFSLSGFDKVHDEMKKCFGTSGVTSGP